MSTLKVTAERLTIHEHPNADALELAQVGLYRSVVRKGEYRTGDWALFIPEQAILPPDLLEELGLTGKLAGPGKNRVKAIRLRGELSQGIVCRPKEFFEADPDMWKFWHDGGTDFADVLGITKWTPEIPSNMAGEVEAAPELIRWIDIENLQRYPDIFSPGEEVISTEKLHGSCVISCYIADTDTLLVSSKGYGSKNLALIESDTNLYWRAVRAADLKEKMRKIATVQTSRRVAVFGEVFGKGVQDLHYGANAGRDEEIGFRVFDVKLDAEWGTEFVNAQIFHAFCAAYELDPVPILYSGPFDIEAMKLISVGKTKIGGDHIREGVVIRPAVEGYSEILGGRKIAKLVSPEYLLRKNGTEYE